MATKVYSLYIFDRHCNPVYFQDWTHLHHPQRASNLSSQLNGSSGGGVQSPELGHASTSGSVAGPAAASGVGDTSIETIAISETSTTTSAFQSLSSSLRSATHAALLRNTASASASAAASGAAATAALRKAGSVLPNVTRSVSKPSTPAHVTVAAAQQQRARQRGSITSSTAAASGPTAALPGHNALPFDEQAKLVYGVVFSLRNMCRKLSSSSGNAPTAVQSGTIPNSSSAAVSLTLTDSFQSYTTPTYTLTHFQSPTMYTFVLLTDPLPAANGYLGAATSPASASGGSGIGSGTSGSSSSGTSTTGGETRSGSSLISGYSLSSRFSSASTSTSADVSGGFAAGPASSSPGEPGAIPGAGGMTLRAVLQTIWRGPWVQHVARNPLCKHGLERAPSDGQEGTIHERRFGVDSDGFRESVEKVFAQYKLSAPPSTAYSYSHSNAAAVVA